MRLHKADNHIDALLTHDARIVQHVIGFAHARRRADIDTQLGRLGLLVQLELSHRLTHLHGMADLVDDSHRKRELERGSVAQAALDGDLAAERLD